MKCNLINLLANTVSSKFVILFAACAAVFLVLLIILCVVARKKGKAYEKSLGAEEKAESATEEKEEAPVEETTAEEEPANEEVAEEVVEETPAEEEKPAEEPAEDEESVEEKVTEEASEEAPVEEKTEETPVTEETEEKEEAPVEETEEKEEAPVAAVKTDEKESYDEDEEKERAVKGKYVIVSEGPNYRYKLKASNGEVIIVSEPYTSEKSVRTGIETLKKNLDTSHCDVVEDKHGLFSFRVMTPQGRCLATSANYSTKASATNAIESYKRWAKSENIVVDDNADADHSEVEKVDFEIEQENTGTYIIKEEGDGFVYQLIAANKRVIATSLVYQSKDSCKEALEKFRNVVYEGSFYVYKDKNAKYQFKLYNKQSRLVLAGEVYDSKQAVISVVETIKRLAKLATLVEAE